MFNDLLILQLFTTIVLLFFINSVNILTLWYLAGIYLLSLGFILLYNDADIFIGFLWVIDLGVGLIFFIFILHFSNFLYQKIIFNLIENFFTLIFVFFIFITTIFFFILIPFEINFNIELKKTWFFFLSWYNYYDFFNIFVITDLNLLKYLYFMNNSFEFFLINFIIFYGIFASINLSFLIKRIFNFLNLSQIKNNKLNKEIGTNFFIRNQNFIKQQNTSTVTRVWIKKKNFLNDF